MRPRLPFPAFLLVLPLAVTLALPAPLAAQADTLAPRINKLEKEMRAVQRKVFPNGGTILEPEIAAPSSPATAPGVPATSPLADLTARVSALESQLATITGQNEENGYKIRQLQDQLAKLTANADARLKALEGPADPAPATAPDGEPVAPPPVRPTTRPAPAPAAAPASDNAAVAAVQRPSTGNEAEDRYIYGFRLWQAKLYPEAEAELKAVATKFPQHRRASYAQNLLGRAYADQGKQALASVAFYDNYQKMPRGERAAESLYRLGLSLTELKKPADACKAFDEFNDVYGATADAALKADVAAGRKAARCR
ncbi:YbgF trimerization domain-containing protein [Sphingomonas flavalba]|uniref:YbgF trimerization domain-containing protein n=1 Tax=Sphingomonas flavalba TaxID=2559804 RepID=UPI00109D8D67|nr:YbgF trimerization domain-containing protein [Sphingomonas flavalba]